MPTRRPQETRILLFLAVLAVGVLWLRMSSHWVSHNYNLSSEANGLYGALNFASGKALYASKDVRPYHVYLYGPLHGWVNGGLLRLFPNTDLHTRVVFIRTFSLLCFLAMMALLWSTHLRHHFEWEEGLLWLGLSLSRFADYATTSRNDTFNLLLEMLAILSFIRYIRTSRKSAAVLFFVFGFAAFLTRPTAVVLLLSAGAYLITAREYKKCLWIFLAGILFASSYFLLNHFTEGAFFESVILANLRGFRPLNRQFFDPSLLSFLFIYGPVAILTLEGIRRGFSQPWERFLFLYLCLSLTLALSTFLRAGGDVNYFFPAILAGIYFATQPLKELLQSKWQILLCLPLTGVVAVYLIKTTVSNARSDVNFAEGAAYLRSHYEPYIYFGGGWAANMDIYMPDRIYHGPDVTDTGQVARNAHPSLRWILEDMDEAIHSGKIGVAVWVDPHCKKWKRFYSNLGLKRGTFADFNQLKTPFPWMCVFERGDQNPPSSTLSRK